MHNRISVNSICFMQSSFDQQAEYWHTLAAQRVSLVAPQLDGEGLAAAQTALATGSYAIETIMHPFSFDRRLDDQGDWEPTRARLLARIETAAQLGARSIYMTTGGHGSLTWEQAAQRFAGLIAPAVEHARNLGIALMIENAPAQYADMHLAHSLRDTIALAELANIGVCIDLIGCWAEADLKSLIERAIPLCQLVQVSDYVCGDRSLPSRAVPGDGDMPLRRLLEWLLEAGYQGTFDLELLGPRIDQEGQLPAVQRAGDKLGQLLHSLGV